MVRTKKSQGQNGISDRISPLADLAALCRAGQQGSNTLTRVLQLIKNIVFFDAASLYLFDRKKDRLEQAASLGGGVELLSFLSVGMGKGLSGWTAQNKKPVVLLERSSNSSFDQDNEYASFLSLPLLIEEDIIGVLNLGCVEARAFTDHNVKLLTIVADHLALCLERLNYREEIEFLNGRLEEAQERLQQVQSGIPDTDRLAEVPPLASSANHGINNALAVVVGNVECLLSENAAPNQKALSRLRRIESAALQITTFNRMILEISSLVQANLASTKDAGQSSPDKTTHDDI